MIKEYFDLIIVAFLALSIAMYDMTIDFFLDMLHLIFEMLHMAFEWIELGIEHTVEHIFHTSRHGSQIITFYILLLIGGLLAYWLSRVMPRLHQQFKQFALQAWLRRKTECQVYWLSMTFTNKLRLVSTVVGTVFLTSFLVM